MMTVTEFFEKYNGDISELNIKTYIPTEEKMNIINAAVEKVIQSDDKFIATYNSVIAEIAKEISLISAYLGLVFENLEDYDRIKETGVLDDWCTGIDHDTFKYYYDLRLQDAIRDANSIDGVTNRIMKALGETLDSLNPEVLSKLLNKVIGE